jgi:phosphoribosyl 1,2-cyclic phosphodiesterase
VIDCGFSRKQTAQRLSSLGVDPQSVCGILITHEHVDHIRGATLFSREASAPILATQGTLEGGGLATTGAQSLADIQPLACGSRIQHQAFQITPIRVSHDTREPCAFLVEVDGMRSLFATDIGTAEGLDVSAAANLDFLYVEANHDEEMLRDGPYPAFLKHRVAGDEGHLSNRDSGRLIKSLAAQSPRLQAVMLAHLSDKNNDPAIALRDAQEHAGALPKLRWHVAQQDYSTEMT